MISSLVDLAISRARLTLVALALPARRRPVRLPVDPQGGGAGRQDPDHLRQRHAARHQPGGRRAADPAAARDAAEIGHERQGDALRRLRGRRLCAARIRGRLRFRQGARRRARQGRRRQERPAARGRRAEGAGGQPLALPGAGGGARRRPAGTQPRAPRPRREDRHRADARRAVGGAARGARRIRRDHRRADAPEELRRLPRRPHPLRRRRQQPGRGRRHGGRHGPLRRQGAGPDRAARGRPQAARRRLERRVA